MILSTDIGLSIRPVRVTTTEWVFARAWLQYHHPRARVLNDQETLLLDDAVAMVDHYADQEWVVHLADGGHWRVQRTRDGCTACGQSGPGILRNEDGVV